MKREDAIGRLKEREADLRKLGVQHLFLFGSTSRDEAKAGSDVDLFFDYDKATFGLFDLMDVKEFTSMALGVKADITTRDSLHRVLRDGIEADAVRIF